MKMGQTVSPETLVFYLNQTPSNYPKEDNFNTMNHGESLKLNKVICLVFPIGHVVPLEVAAILLMLAQ
jgi:hypothetical protein